MAAANSYIIATQPAVLVAERLLAAAGQPRGLVSPNDFFSADELFAELDRLGIGLRRF